MLLFLGTYPDVKKTERVFFLIEVRYIHTVLLQQLETEETAGLTFQQRNASNPLFFNLKGNTRPGSQIRML